MVVSCMYNKENKVLVLATQKKHVKTEVNGDIVSLLDSEGQVVGVNVFNVENYNNGIVKLNAEHDSLKELFNDFEYGFEFGEIKECVAHPKSEKLQICQVLISSGVTQIVCGAKNCEAGHLAAVAKVGAVMPGGMLIKPSKLMDVESNGMLCSEKELGNINSDKVGIILKELNPEMVGQAYE